MPCDCHMRDLCLEKRQKRSNRKKEKAAEWRFKKKKKIDYPGGQERHSGRQKFCGERTQEVQLEAAGGCFTMHDCRRACLNKMVFV